EREFGLATEQALTNYTWPGNVRELENACKRAAVLKPSGALEFTDFGLNQTQNVTQPNTNKEPNKDEIEAAMREYHGVVAKVARHFGLSRQALYRRLQKFDIDY
ncbi:MAG: helix-turn-helix domain-containing protein, partial [Pseudomonadota bacterium]